MKKEANILKKLWFNFGVVPVISIVIWLIYFFTRQGNAIEAHLFGWFIIWLTAMIIEFFLLFKYKVKYKGEHYMFISISVLLSIFVGFVITDVFLKDKNYAWYKDIWIQLLPMLFLFIFKTLIWQLLNLRSVEHNNKDNRIEKLTNENEELKEINLQLIDENKVLMESTKEIKDHDSKQNYEVHSIEPLEPK